MARVFTRFNARVLLIVLTVLVAVVFLPPYSHGFSTHWLGGTYGVNMSRDGAMYVASVDPGSPASNAGVRPGDRVVFEPFSTKTLALGWPRPGDRMTVRFEHENGQIQQASIVAVPAGPTPAWETAILVTSLIVDFPFVAIAFVLVYLRPSLMTWAFYVYAVGYASTSPALAFYHAVLPYWAFMPLAFVLGTVFGNFVAMPLLPFVLRFPNQRMDGWRRVADRWIWTAIALAFGAYVLEWVQVRATGESPSWGAALDEWLPLGVFAVAALIIIKNYKESNPATRARTGFLIVGAIMSFLAYAVYFVPSLGSGPASAIALLAVLLPVCVAYGVLRHRVLDINFVLNRALAYAALSVAVVISVTLLDWFSSQRLSKAHFATQLEIAVTIGIGFGLARVNRAMERTIDVLVFRKRYEAEKYLARVAEALPYATAEDAITDGLVREPVEALDLAAGALYRRSDNGRRFRGVGTSHATGVAPMGFDANHNLVRFLQSGEGIVWLDDVRSQLDPENSAVYVLAVPVTVRHELVSFVLYGAHSNGAQIDPDEVRLLVKLAREAARAYDHVEAVRTRELMARLTGATPQTT